MSALKTSEFWRHLCKTSKCVFFLFRSPICCPPLEGLARPSERGPAGEIIPCSIFISFNLISEQGMMKSELRIFLGFIRWSCVIITLTHPCPSLKKEGKLTAENAKIHQLVKYSILPVFRSPVSCFRYPVSDLTFNFVSFVSFALIRQVGLRAGGFFFFLSTFILL